MGGRAILFPTIFFFYHIRCIIMDRRNILLWASAVPAAIASAQGRYNVVYIMTDDHTAQMMSCYDNRFVKTPNLDRIAADGVKFVNS